MSRPAEERLEVTDVFSAVRNFRRRYTLRRQTVFDWNVPWALVFLRRSSVGRSLLNSPASTMIHGSGFTDVFLLQILVADPPRRTCQNIRQRAHVRSKLRALYNNFSRFLVNSRVHSSFTRSPLTGILYLFPFYLYSILILFLFCSQSKYKSLLVSEQTTVDELIQMLLSCYSSKERVEQFSLYEVCEGEEYQRKLHPDDSPLKVTQRWTSADRHLRIRRNPDYNPHRRKVRELASPYDSANRTAIVE